jgi:hypothetical protein
VPIDMTKKVNIIEKILESIVQYWHTHNTLSSQLLTFGTTKKS